jgi:flagellar motor component MotA
MKRFVAGQHWKKEDYRDLLSLMFSIVKLLKTRGVLALEPHVDKPHESTLFAKYPKIQKDHFALDFIADTLRMMTMSMDDPFQVEECMQRQLKKHHAELHARVAAIQSVADGMPALGIVAAVLGVIKTMASISSPVEVLGGMIGGALVGTFWACSWPTASSARSPAASTRPTSRTSSSTRSSATAWSPTSRATPRRGGRTRPQATCRPCSSPPSTTWTGC